MERAEKAELVASLNAVFQTTGSVVVCHNLGLTVAQVNDLRGQMAKAGATVKVAKNRLAKLALDGTPATGLADLFKGPTMLAYAGDPIAAPKVATGFARTNDKFVVLGGTLGGSRLDPQGVKALADLPSLDELRARLDWHDPDPCNPPRGAVAGARQPACKGVEGLCRQGQCFGRVTDPAVNLVQTYRKE